MPSADQHRGKAARNREFLNSIPIADFPEWVVVAAFYTAVHHVERLRHAAGDGHSTSHEDRLEYVQHHFPDPIHSAYHILQNASMLARYQSVAAFFAQLTSGDVEERIITRLAEIERFVTERLH